MAFPADKLTRIVSVRWDDDDEDDESCFPIFPQGFPGSFRYGTREVFQAFVGLDGQPSETQPTPTSPFVWWVQSFIGTPPPGFGEYTRLLWDPTDGTGWLPGGTSCDLTTDFPIGGTPGDP